MYQNKKNLSRMIEIVMLAIFLILWAMLISGHRLSENEVWEKFEKKIPIRPEILKDAGETLINHAKNEMVPLLSYEDYLGEDNVLLPFFRSIMQTEMFPIQQYSVDYWDGNDNFSSLYSDRVPDYFTESDDESVEDKKTDPGNMDNTGTGTTYSLAKLTDYKFLLEHFYIVDETTTMTKTDLDGKKLLQTDLSVKMKGEDPLVLIYHTHGSETYKKENGKTGSVIDVGKRLKK